MTRFFRRKIRSKLEARKWLTRLQTKLACNHNNDMVENTLILANTFIIAFSVMRRMKG